jgi:hypothetical protein
MGDLKSTFLVHDPVGENPLVGANLGSVFFQGRNEEVRNIREDRELINHI